jgi:hypothetical protein
MKTHTFQAACATLAALALILAPARAQEDREVAVPIKDTAAQQNTATGNITSLAPTAIFIKGAGDAHPTAYNTTADTAYVDDDGTAAEKASAKIGHAVIITYVVQNGSRIALKVVVRNAP